MRSRVLSLFIACVPMLVPLTVTAAAPARQLADVRLLYFHASWCGSCARLEEAGVLEAITRQRPGLIVERVDVDRHRARMEKHGVTATPTLVLVDADDVAIGAPRIDLDDAEGTVKRVLKLVDKATGAGKPAR